MFFFSSSHFIISIANVAAHCCRSIQLFFHPFVNLPVNIFSQPIILCCWNASLYSKLISSSFRSCATLFLPHFHFHLHPMPLPGEYCRLLVPDQYLPQLSIVVHSVSVGQPVVLWASVCDQCVSHSYWGIGRYVLLSPQLLLCGTDILLIILVRTCMLCLPCTNGGYKTSPNALLNTLSPQNVSLLGKSVSIRWKVCWCIWSLTSTRCIFGCTNASNAAYLYCCSHGLITCASSLILCGVSTSGRLLCSVMSMAPWRWASTILYSLESSVCCLPSSSNWIWVDLVCCWCWHQSCWSQEPSCCWARCLSSAILWGLMVVGDVIHATRDWRRCLKPWRVMLVMQLVHSSQWALDIKCCWHGHLWMDSYDLTLVYASFVMYCPHTVTVLAMVVMLRQINICGRVSTGVAAWGWMLSSVVWQ